MAVHCWWEVAGSGGFVLIWRLEVSAKCGGNAAEVWVKGGFGGFLAGDWGVFVVGLSGCNMLLMWVLRL